MEYQKIQSKLSKYIDEDIVADIALCVANSTVLYKSQKVGLLSNLLKGVAVSYKKGQEDLIADTKQKVSNILDGDESNILKGTVELLKELEPLEINFNKVRYEKQKD